MSRIEQIISEIEEYIDSCKYQPLSNAKIIVNRNELGELVEELKEAIPDEIKRYQRIIANRDAILKDAQEKSEDIIQKANEMTANLVSEHEIMQQAYKEANQVIEEATKKAGKILDRATLEANEVKRAAMQYTDNSLASIQEILSTAIEEMTVKHDGLIRSLESSLDITTQNRKELRATPMPAATYAQRVEEQEQLDEIFEAELDDVFDDLDAYDQYVTEEEYYEEPVYGQHNPSRQSTDNSGRAGNYGQAADNGDITDFNLDISDFK